MIDTVSFDVKIGYACADATLDIPYSIASFIDDSIMIFEVAH